MLALFLLEVAAENHKTQSKEGEDERVFFGFGDDLAVKDNSHRAVRLRRKPGIPIASTHNIIEGSRKEIADGFVQNAGARPSRRLPAGIAQTAPGDTNPHDITKRRTSVIQEKIGNGSAAAADGNRRRVRRAGGKGNVGLAASGNSGQHRVPVRGIGAGKQGRQRDRLVAGLVGVEDVPIAVVVDSLPRVSIVVRRPGGSDAIATTRGGGAAKNPEGLCCGVVLAGIDVNQQLRLGCCTPPPQMQKTATNNDSFCFIKI